ncbi:MAG TPA: TolC family protein, partial [Candidatus Angelobacter sp.]|nr:TolC family protein [Candidatus Angelobacter sp.]
GEVAQQAADVKRMQLDATRASVADTVKSDYLQLAYLQMTLGILQENQRVLDQIIRNATAHYEVGQGLQADVLRAQVERTKLLRELTVHGEQTGQIEAQLKGILNRDQESPDIVAEPLSETPLRLSSAALLQLVREHNPEVQVDASSVGQKRAALKSAESEAKPDFSVAYMYQNTDRKYRDYYMFTFNVRLPRRARTRAEVAEAADKLAQSRATLDAHLQQQLAEVKQEYVMASTDAKLLTEYREGLIPQSDATYHSTLNAYASNRDDLVNVLHAITNDLVLRLDYAQTLADHETALAHLETLTGATLR